jgi:hypothetical protein
LPGNTLTVGARTKKGVQIVDHGPGAVLTLSDKEGERVIAAGVAKEVAEVAEVAEEAKPAKGGKPKAEEK